MFSIAELEQAVALKYLYGWLSNHPKYGILATPELADSLYHANVSVVFGISLSLPALSIEPLKFHLEHSEKNEEREVFSY